MKYISLKGKKKFKQLFRQGRFYGSSYISLKVLFRQETALEQSESQWALCVSSKLGASVVRNRYRRICKESLLALTLEAKTKVKTNSYIALFPQESFARLNFKKRVDALRSLLKKAKLISHYV